MLLFHHPPLCSYTGIQMLGHLDPEVGLGLLLVTVVLTATPVAADDVALVPLMTADDIGIPLVLAFADLWAGKYCQRSLQLQ